MTFKDYFGKKSVTGNNLETKKRHMHPVVRDASSHPRHPGRTVPHMHRAKVENSKVARLKKAKGKFTLNNKELAEIQQVYNVQLDKNKPKSLGNTGIILRYDPVINAAVLERNE